LILLVKALQPFKLAEINPEVSPSVNQPNSKPTVHIYDTNANPAHLSEICAGLEEEGIPFTLTKEAKDDVLTLAHKAANHSRLRVGIGITAKAAALQIRNCPIDKPVFLIEISTSTPNPHFRKLGTNAARAVKGGVFI